MQKGLAKEKQRIEQEIERLRVEVPDSPSIQQYEKILVSLTKNLNFYAKNYRIDQILALESQLHQLYQRLARPNFPESFRREIWLRDKKKCYLCEKKIESWLGELMHIDHVVPRIKGGSDEPHNLRIAHPTCNLLKSDRELEDRVMKRVLRELRKSDEEKAKERLF